MRYTFFAITILAAALAGGLQAAKPAPSFHKVRRGETAARIARDNGLSMDQLEAINPDLNLSRLTAGTRVKIKGAARTEAARSATRQAVRHNLAPMPDLPATPAPGPTTFTHLERILPVTVREASATAVPEASPALTGIQPVLPASSASVSVQGEGFLPADRDHLDLLWPVETRTVSSAWGPRMRSKTIKVRHARRKKVKYRGSHKGVDLTAPMGTDVYAAMDGRVVSAGSQKGYGNFVVVDHGNGVLTLYGHHSRNLVAEGEIVHRGQKIAEVGMTGNATGPHLHFELRVDGAPTNPLPYLNDVEDLPADQIAQNDADAPRSRR
jgi:murein DD-endopeptidase MepM/ murein hydrolase activator NlpD